MRIAMKTPCDACPFVRSVGFYLRPSRVDEFAEHVGGGFPCHKTVDYSGEDEEEDRSARRWGEGSKEVHCAGSLILQWKEFGGFDGIVALVASRLSAKEGWHPEKDLDLDADVFDSFGEMREAMEELDAGVDAAVRRDVDSASLEELEAAADIYERLTEGK